jgi:hypothetical protein
LREKGMNRALITGAAAVVLMLIAGMSLAGQELGSATPQSPEGKWSVGAGYYRCEAEYQAEDTDRLDLSDVSRNLAFVGVGYGFAENWEVYLRAGGADWTSLGALPVTPRGNVEAGYKPFFSLGLRGSVYRKDIFALGFIGQYNYFFKYDVAQSGETGVDVKEPYTAEVNFKDVYDLNLGLNFDIVPSWGAVYVGWFWFRGAGRAESSIEVADDPAHVFAGDIEENGHMGGFGGLRLEFGRGWNVTGEVQYRTRGSASISLNKVFGV